MESSVIDDDVTGYLYIVQLREHVNLAEGVYKVGRTRDVIQRMADYPANSALMACAQVSDMFDGERQLLAALRGAHVQRSDIGSEYFEAPLGNVMAALNAVVAASLPRAPRRWPRRARPVAEIVAEPVVKRCAEVVAAWVDERMAVGGHRSQQLAAPADIANHIEAFVEEKGWQCSTISPINVCNKLVKFHACRTIFTATGTALIAFPDAGDASDASDAGDNVNVDVTLDAFLAARCVVQSGMRQPSVEFLKAFNDFAPHAARLHDKALPILMRARGFEKKRMWIGDGLYTCYQGLKLNII